MKDLSYSIPGSDQILFIELVVLEHLMLYQQLSDTDREAGGQLFGYFDQNTVVISVVTDPKPNDLRSRFSFIPNRRAERREIERMHSANLHFIGDWHTHPEPRPVPSSRDIRTMNDLFTRSTHQLGAMVMLIVGQEDPPMGLHVSICDSASCRQLHSS